MMEFLPFILLVVPTLFGLLGWVGYKNKMAQKRLRDYEEDHLHRRWSGGGQE